MVFIMKKVILVLSLIILATMLLTSCASANLSTDSSRPSYGAAQSRARDEMAFGLATEAPAMAPTARADFAESDDFWSENTLLAVGGDSAGGFVPITPPVSQSSLAEKIIYTVTADLETLDYEGAIDAVHQLMALHGAFIENSFVGGVNLESTFHGWRNMRQASFTLRVPTNRLNAVTSALSEIGNVASLSSDAQNITAQFSDTDSRLRSLRVQEERLLEMLTEADNIEDLLAIEDRLAGIRWQVESLTSTLRNWQNQIDYSTVHLFIREVENYTLPQEQEPDRTYWQRMGAGISDTISEVGRFFTELFMGFVVNLPIILIVLLVIIAVILIIRTVVRKRRGKGKKALDEANSIFENATSDNSN